MRKGCGNHRRLPVVVVRDALLDRCAPVAEEFRGPNAASGCVLARAEQAACDLPAAALALADGWAVAAADTFAASPYTSLAIDRGHAVAIGQPVPDGCNAVVPQDAVVMEGGRPMVQTPLATGANLRRIGEDARRGEAVLATGRRLTPLGATLAGLVGVKSVAVRVPRVLILHEEAGLAAAQLVAHAARQGGAACRIAAIGSTEQPPDGSPTHLIIAVGGAAIGPHDAALARVAALDGWQAIGCPAMRPGDTVMCGVAGDCPVVVMPSRLDAVLASLLLIVRPLIDALTGSADRPGRQQRTLTRKISSAVGLTELVLLADAEDGRAWTPIGVGGFDWLAAASAAAYAEIPPESEGAGEGQVFEATMLTGPGSTGLWSET